MARPTRIHADKRPQRIHYIPEWAEKRGLIQADLVRKLGVDKGTVSRWFGGQVPDESNLFPLAQALGADEPGALFRHPDDDWIARFFRERDEEDREQARRVLEAAFPPSRQLRKSGKAA